MSTVETAAPSEDFLAPYWEAAAEGRLLVQRCRSCDALQYYPRRRCVACGADAVVYEQVSGRGTLYSYTTVLRNPPSAFVEDLPYTIAIVRLEEGPQLLTRVIDADPDDLACDMPVTCVFRPFADGRILPCFTTAATAA